MTPEQIAAINKLSNEAIKGSAFKEWLKLRFRGSPVFRYLLKRAKSD